jgi:hypothetical protein
VMDLYDGAVLDRGEYRRPQGRIAAGRSIEEAAPFLCRADGAEDVRQKCQELGLGRELELG